jgi:hypothetical protein
VLQVKDKKATGSRIPTPATGMVFTAIQIIKKFILWKNQKK